jgi:hypothetical protein
MIEKCVVKFELSNHKLEFEYRYRFLEKLYLKASFSSACPFLYERAGIFNFSLSCHVGGHGAVS